MSSPEQILKWYIKVSLSVSPIFVYIIKNNVIAMFLMNYVTFYSTGIIFTIKK